MLIQLILVLLMVIALGVTWKRAHQNVIPMREALAWSILWIVIGVVTALPETATWAAHLLGVGRGADLVLYSAVALIFLLLFKLFIQHEKLEHRLTDIVRLEALREMKEELESADGSEDGCCGGSCCHSDESNVQ